MKRIWLLFCFAAIFIQTAFATDPVIDVNNYQWKGNPIILKTSKVFANDEGMAACGKQEYEVCIGAAELKSGVTATTTNPITVKCFIPPNQTVCPPVKKQEQCFVAGVATPADPADRPKCDGRKPQNDNLTYGCNCSLYGRSNHIRQTAAICESEMRARMAEAARAAAARDAAARDAAERQAAAVCTNGVPKPNASGCDCFQGFVPTPPYGACRPPQISCGSGVTDRPCDCCGVTIGAGATCPPPACHRLNNPLACRCGDTVLGFGGSCASAPEDPPPTNPCIGGTLNSNNQCVCGNLQISITGNCMAPTSDAANEAVAHSCSAGNCHQ